MKSLKLYILEMMGDMKFLADINSLFLNLDKFTAKIIICVFIYVLCVLIYILGCFCIVKAIQCIIRNIEKKFGYNINSYILINMFKVCYFFVPIVMTSSIGTVLINFEHVFDFFETLYDENKVVIYMQDSTKVHFYTIMNSPAEPEEHISMDMNYQDRKIYFSQFFMGNVKDLYLDEKITEVKLVLPVDTPIQLIYAIYDRAGTHHWILPDQNIDMHVEPGQIYSTLLIIDKPGIYYGQCSQIGISVNNESMPIIVEAVSYEDFCTYMKENGAVHVRFKYILEEDGMD